MKSVNLKIYAKINLSLNILGNQGNMHLLDMVLASVDIYDAISVCLREDNRTSVSFSREDIPKDNNSVTKAIDAVREIIGDFGVDVSVQKNIPIAAGLGGSSADAAGVILAFDRLLGLKKSGIDLCKIAKKTGSDTFYMLEGGFKRVLGTGDMLEDIDSDSVLNLVLAGPDAGCLAGDAYKKFDEIYTACRFEPSSNNQLISALKANDFSKIILNTGNALFEPATMLCPAILKVFESVKECSPCSVFMTGSGSFIVGIFHSLIEAKKAAETLKQKHYFAKACTTKSRGYEFLTD